MKTIVIISFSNLKSDPRVNRQIRFLSESYKLITIGLGNPEIDGIIYFSSRGKAINNYYDKFKNLVKLLIGAYDSYYLKRSDVIHCANILKNIECDLIISNDIDTLPLALLFNKKVIFDAHEYAPLEFEDKLVFRIIRQPFITYLCNKYIPKVNSMLTVCESIAKTYQNTIKIKPFVITNAPDYENLYPNYINKSSTKIRLIHHGAAIKSRKIENMIEMMRFLDDRFEINFMLVSQDNNYLNNLKCLAKNNHNIRFLNPVPMRELCGFTNQFDIGVFLLEPTNFNYRFALPNKLFEFIQARLAIAIAPSPEMAKVVKQYDCGVVSEDFSPQSLAQSLMQLDIDKINYYKQRSHEAAYELSAEKNKEKLLEIVASILQE